MEKECCCNSTINLEGYVVVNAGCRIHGLRVKSIQSTEEFIEETVEKAKKSK